MSNNKPTAYLDELNEIQRNAVTSLEGPVMVIAGPGSGKTRVLTYRIAHLINSGVPPWQILTLTFTNKAAREMKERIENVVGSSANRVWAGTFHSIFSRILRSEAHLIGFPNDFTIYDTDDSKSLIRELIKSMKLDKSTYNVSAVLSRISMSKSKLITPKAYAANPDMMNYDKMNRRPMMHMIYQKYVKRCERSGAMDFDDLLLMMFKLLYQNPNNVREKYQQQFRYIMVDEFQDTNFLQYEIIKLFVHFPNSPYNVCIVGDDAQSIYSFRGATIENILQFTRDFPSVKTFKLEQNYRSTKYIVEAANTLIGYNEKQIKKTIWTDLGDGDKITVIHAQTDIEEGRRVADSIVETKNRYHLQNSDIAILYRTNGQSRVFEEQLRRFNIPYRIYGGLSFYNRKEVKDLLAYIRLTVNSKDDEALKRIINYPKRGIGNTTVDKLTQIAEDNNTSLYETLLQIQFTGRAKTTVPEFIKIIESAKQKNGVSDAYETANYIAKISGIRTLLKADDSPEGISRVDNLTALLDGIKEFSENDEVREGEDDDRSLSKYIQSIALLTDADEDKDDTDVVTLMSVHASKGLEFKSVFIVGLEENLFPSFMAMNSPDQIDEERRLFYVAVTRAERFLTLSYCNNRYQYGQVRTNDPSRFLEEIPESSINNISIVKPNSQPFGSPKLMGNFKTLTGSKKSLIKVDVANFKASPMEDIKVGKTVIHLKFGEGVVTAVDNRNVATIVFKEVVDAPEKRIMLQFAKLQVVD